MSGIKYGQPERNRRKSFAYSIPIYGYLGKFRDLGLDACVYRCRDPQNM